MLIQSIIQINIDVEQKKNRRTKRKNHSQVEIERNLNNMKRGNMTQCVDMKRKPKIHLRTRWGPWWPSGQGS